jgi:hypothetical protein
MAASISEFERRKPTKTYKMFKELLAKYSKLGELSPAMDDVDFAIQRTAVMAAEDINELFKLFQSGE